MGVTSVPYAGNGYASLDFLEWLTAVEIFLLLVSLVVLGVAFLMFVRLFDALSPPTKALTWVVGGNFVLALFLLAFACFQQHFFLQRQYIPQGGAFCHYCNPVVLSLVVFNWLGQPVIAWITLKTLRNEEVTDGRLRRLYYGCVALAFAIYVWGVTLSPGVIVNGSFCVMIPKRPDYFDARGFGAFVGIVSFFAAVVLYIKSYYHLRRVRRKLIKDLKRIQHARAAAADEAKEPELSSIGQLSSRMSRSGGPSEWTGNVAWEGSSTMGDLESGHWGGFGAEGGAEDGSLDSEDDSFDSEDDVPFTYGQLQARTQAARAAVNILLPNRTDDMAEREGPYGMRRRDGKARGRRLLEEGVDLSALMEPKPDAPGAGSSIGNEGRGLSDTEEQPAPWWRRLRWCQRQQQQKELDSNAEVLELYSKATRALVVRACTLLFVYFGPTYILQACLGHYKHYRPPAELLPIFGFVFFLGTPVLQTVALLHLAVTIGSNILRFYRQYVAQHGEPEPLDGTAAAVLEGAVVMLEVTPSTSANEEETKSSLPAGFLYERGQGGPAAFGAVGAAGGGSGVGGAVDPEKRATGPVAVGGGAQSAPPASGACTPAARPAHPPAGPLGIPQPSAFRRYAGRGQHRAAPPRPASRQGHMQALSTIYEVAFKSRGRDAAAAFRHSMSTPQPPPTGAATDGAPASSSGGGGVASAAGKDKAEQQGTELVRKRAEAATDDEDGSSGSGSGGGADALSRATTALQTNTLMQEMLGVKMRSSSGSGSSASGDSCTSSSAGGGSVASSLSDERGDGSTPHGDGQGHARVQGFFPWLGLPRSRSLSFAEQSEVSSLTDAHDYQTLASSLATSPALTPCGLHALSPARAKQQRPASVGSSSLLDAPFASSGEEGGTSSDNPSSSGGGSSTDSWADKAPGGVGGSGGMSVAGMTHASGSSGGSSNSSGGRSIVTESEWKDWMMLQGKREGLVGGGEGEERAHVTMPRS